MEIIQYIFDSIDDLHDFGRLMMVCKPLQQQVQEASLPLNWSVNFTENALLIPRLQKYRRGDIKSTAHSGNDIISVHCNNRVFIKQPASSPSLKLPFTNIKNFTLTVPVPWPRELRVHLPAISRWISSGFPNLRQLSVQLHVGYDYKGRWRSITQMMYGGHGSHGIAFVLKEYMDRHVRFQGNVELLVVPSEWLRRRVSSIDINEEIKQRYFQGFGLPTERSTQGAKYTTGTE